MVRLLFCAAMLTVWVLPPPPAAFGQSDPLKGVVWSVPDGVAAAEADLRTMSAMGVEAVRTDLSISERILATADSLGLQLYLDLPITGLAAQRLLDTLGYALALVDTAAARARAHASVRGVGLARRSDTSDPGSCAYFEALTERLRTGTSGRVISYYTGRFVGDDACSHVVDVVLVELMDVDDPIGRLQGWTSVEGRPRPGVGALGWWVRSDSLRGLRVPDSPERQARYFERYLPMLLGDTSGVTPHVVFVYRWRDVRRGNVGAAYDLDDPFVRRYGLHAADGTPRPALDVVEGTFERRHAMFAFDTGVPPPSSPPWTTLLGWGVLSALGIIYALSPRFRHMVPRYFQARFFFREAVREGRDVLLGVSMVLLACLGTAGGLTAFALADTVRKFTLFSLGLSWLSAGVQSAIVTLLARPLILVVLVGCVYVAGLLMWTVLLSLLSSRYHGVTPSQVLMLVVWPRWPIFLVMIGAMVVAATPKAGLGVAIGLAAAWILVELAALLQTLVDMSAVSRISLTITAAALILHPFVLLAAVLVAFTMGFQPELEYLWHAATRR
ncbi:MAG: hypothetical protein WD423_15875 [Rhodothermales bacterium]